MQLDRRTMMAGTAAALAAAPVLARQKGASGWYDRAIVIDALGGTGDPYMADGVSRMSDRGWAETLATGVTAVRDTVMPVGNVPDPWGDYQKDMVGKQELIAANPDRLILVRSAADILKAKREKKFGIIIGTQDTAMVGGDLDRLAQMKKDGGMTVQPAASSAETSGSAVGSGRKNEVTEPSLS